MENEVITLVSQVFASDTDGDTTATETQKNVFAKRVSIGLKRKLEALEAGLKLEYKFILADEYDYSNEEVLIYNNVRYNIVNAFINDAHEVELLTARY